MKHSLKQIPLGSGRVASLTPVAALMMKEDGSLGWILLGTLDHVEKENDKMGCFISKL